MTADPCLMPTGDGEACDLPGDHPHGDGCQPDVPQCGYCHGDGWFTETIEGPDGRDIDIDYVCGACGGSGVDQ